MERFARVVRRLGRHKSWLLAVVVIVAPVAEAWWSLFSADALVPTLLGNEESGGMSVSQQWLILIPPVVLALGIGWFIYSITKPIRPFLPERVASSTEVDGIISFTVRIENGVADVFHGCYAHIVAFVRVTGTPTISGKLPQQRDRLMWSAYTQRTRPIISLGSLSSEELVVARYDKSNPAQFKVPIGPSTDVNVERNGVYQMTVEVGTEQSSSTPAQFQFTISAHDEDYIGLVISQIDSIEA